MHMLATHLTRMGPPNICVAGFTVTSLSPGSIAVGKHVRPVRKMGQLDKDCMKTFNLGTIVNLGPVQNIGQPPEVEDCSFEPESAAIASRITKEQFWKILEDSRKSNLSTLFGPHLQQRSTTHGPGAVVAPGNGNTSLGELETAQLPKLYVNGDGHLRLQVEDQSFGKLELPVTDVRFYEYKQKDWILETRIVERLAKHIRNSSPNHVILGVGLTRIFREVHWLQVNNIFLKEDPLWS